MTPDPFTGTQDFGPPTGGPNAIHECGIVVVEPHADDAFLSLHGHLTLWRQRGCPVTIVTLCAGDPRRAREAQSYAAAVGARWAGLLFADAGGAGVEWDAEVWRPAIDQLRGPLAPTPTPSDPEQPYQERYWLETGVPARPPRWIFPLGLQHNQHRAARACARPGDWHYVDLPYGLKTGNQEELFTATLGKRIVSVRSPRGTRKTTPVELFKSQSKFFYYNPPEEGWERTLEMIVCG